MATLKRCFICFTTIKQPIGRPLQTSKAVFDTCKNHLSTFFGEDLLRAEGPMAEENQLMYCQGCFEEALKIGEVAKELEALRSSFKERLLIFQMKIMMVRMHAAPWHFRDEDKSMNGPVAINFNNLLQPPTDEINASNISAIQQKEKLYLVSDDNVQILTTDDMSYENSAETTLSDNENLLHPESPQNQDSDIVNTDVLYNMYDTDDEDENMCIDLTDDDNPEDDGHENSVDTQEDENSKDAQENTINAEDENESFENSAYEDENYANDDENYANQDEHFENCEDDEMENVENVADDENENFGNNANDENEIADDENYENNANDEIEIADDENYENEIADDENYENNANDNENDISDDENFENDVESFENNVDDDNEIVAEVEEDENLENNGDDENEIFAEAEENENFEGKEAETDNSESYSHFYCLLEKIEADSHTNPNTDFEEDIDEGRSVSGEVEDCTFDKGIDAITETEKEKAPNPVISPQCQVSLKRIVFRQDGKPVIPKEKRLRRKRKLRQRQNRAKKTGSYQSNNFLENAATSLNPNNLSDTTVSTSSSPPEGENLLESVKEVGETIRTVKRGRPSKKYHQCKVCGFKTGNAVYMEGHMKQHQRPYACILCNNTYKRELDLTKHVKSHTTEPKSYSIKCSDCGKAYSSPSSLRCHRLVHLGNSIQQCVHCNYTSPYRPNVIRHIKTHSNVRGTQCTLCKLFFQNKTAIQTHYQKEHDNIPFTERYKQAFASTSSKVP